MLKKLGYQTAVIGKWHFGTGSDKPIVDCNGEVKPGPLEIGFDYSFLLPSTNDRVPCVSLENHRVVDLDLKDPLHLGKKPDGFKGTEYPDGKKIDLQWPTTQAPQDMIILLSTELAALAISGEVNRLFGMMKRWRMNLLTKSKNTLVVENVMKLTMMLIVS